MSWTPPPTKYYSADPIKNNEMGRTCGTYERQGACIQGIGGETWDLKQLSTPRRRLKDNIKMDMDENFLTSWIRVGF